MSFANALTLTRSKDSRNPIKGIIKYFFAGIIVLWSVSAYSLSRFKFKAKWLLMAWILMVRIFPPVTFVIPLYNMMGKINLLNSRTALILAYIVFNLPFAIWMLISFFNEVPIDIEESAMVDGSSHWHTFRKIVLPLVLPGIAATSIFTFMMGWNEFLYAMIFVQTPELITVPVGLAGLVTEYHVLWGPMSAGGVLSVIPLIIAAIVMVAMILIFSSGYLKRALSTSDLR